MKIVVAYKWARDPQEATVGADGTVDWSRAKPGISDYDPVAIELARRLAEATGAELIGLTAGAKGVGVAIACKAAGQLGWAALAEVTAVSGQAGALRVERAVPGGTQALEISGPAVLAASADAAVARVPGMKDLLSAGKKPVEYLQVSALEVPAANAAVTVTGTSRPDRKARKNQVLDTTDPAAAAAELVTALRGAGAL